MGQRVVFIPLIWYPHHPLCPVAAITHAFFLSPAAHPQSQAFCYQEDSSRLVCFTYKGFMALLHSTFPKLGVCSTEFGTHSFRRGGASFALEAGVPLDTISLMGDWKSDSVYLYLHMPVSQRITAQRKLATYFSAQLPLF